MQQAGYHHANMLADQLCTDLQVQGTEMLAIFQELADANANLPPAVVQPILEPAANAVIQDTIKVEMIRLLRDIAIQNGNNGGRGGRGNYGGRGGYGGCGGYGGRGNNRNRNCRTPDNASFLRRMTSLYCHTRRACNHISADCTRKAPGHEDLATLINRMGGSNAFCPPIAK